MALADEIAVVEADQTKPPAERRRLVYAIKAGALLPFLQARIGQSITRGAVTVTLVNAWADDDGWLCAHILATRNGVTIPVNNPLMFRNPPIGDGSAADLAAWARGIVLDAIG